MIVFIIILLIILSFLIGYMIGIIRLNNIAKKEITKAIAEEMKNNRH